MADEPDDLAPTQRFSTRVEHYAKSRPGYPPELIDLLAREAGLRPEYVLADIGSGTGLLSEPFLKNGNAVIGVEPNREMREAAERLLAGWPNFRSVDGAAESTPLPDASVDGVVAGQAFHWFNGPAAVAEFRRILRPAGFIALIWNARATQLTPFMVEYERIIHEFGTDFALCGKELVPPEILRGLLGPRMRELRLPNHQMLDWEGLRGRVLSASYMPLPGGRRFDEMMQNLRAAFDRFAINAQIKMDYHTLIYLAPAG